MLFDHFYVKPAEIERRKRKLSEKLIDAGKQPLESLQRGEPRYPKHGA
jgi:uncharacterized protein YeeX (DUF496 family)